MNNFGDTSVCGKQIYEKQKKIDYLLVTLINTKPYEYEDKEGSDALRENVERAAVKICEAIDFVIDENYFLPRYYKFSNTLLEIGQQNKGEMSAVSSRVKNLVQKTRTYLEKLRDDPKQDMENAALKRYCSDKKFQYYIEEFYTSITHELIIYDSYVLNGNGQYEQSQLNSITAMQKDLSELSTDIGKLKETAEENAKEIQCRYDETNQAVKDIQGRLSEATSAINEEIEATGKKIKEIEAGFSKKTSKILKKSQDALDKANNSLKDILPNLLTSLGIFVAIIIAVVVIYLAADINHNPRETIIAFFGDNTLWARIVFLTYTGIFSFDLIYVFVFLLAKVAGRSISCTCVYGSCPKCTKPKKCKSLERLWRKYWNLILINVAAALVIAGGLALHWNVKNDQSQPDQESHTIETEQPATTEAGG